MPCLSCPRSSRERETSGRKSWGSAEASGGGPGTGGTSPPTRGPGGGPDEQRSLASDDSLGRVSNILLIPRGPPAQYEVSSSLGYTSTRGENTHTRSLSHTHAHTNLLTGEHRNRNITQYYNINEHYCQFKKNNIVFCSNLKTSL